MTDGEGLYFVISPSGEPVTGFSGAEKDAFEKRACEAMVRAYRLRAVPLTVAERFSVMGNRRSIFEHLGELLDAMDALCSRVEESDR